MHNDIETFEKVKKDRLSTKVRIRAADAIAETDAVQYSLDNGLTWKNLKEPSNTTGPAKYSYMYELTVTDPEFLRIRVRDGLMLDYFTAKTGAKVKKSAVPSGLTGTTAYVNGRPLRVSFTHTDYTELILKDANRNLLLTISDEEDLAIKRENTVLVHLPGSIDTYKFLEWQKESDKIKTN